MKINSILIGLLFVGMQSAFGQMEKGRILVGTNINFSNRANSTTFQYRSQSLVFSATETYESFQLDLNLAPRVGYLLFDQFVVGVDLGIGFHQFYSNSTIMFSSRYDEKEYRFTAGFFVRHYLSRKRLMPFWEVNTFREIYDEKPNIKIIGRNSTSYSQFVGLGGGLAWRVSDRVTLDSQIKYLRSFNSRQFHQVYKAETVYLNLGFTVFVNKMRNKKVD